MQNSESHLERLIILDKKKDLVRFQTQDGIQLCDLALKII